MLYSRCCDVAGLKVEKLERAKKLRLHLVARKATIEKRRDLEPEKKRFEILKQ